MKLFNMKLPKLHIPKITLSKLRIPSIKLHKMNNVYLLMLMFLIIIISPLIISFFQEGMENKKKKNCHKKGHKHGHYHKKYNKDDKKKDKDDCDCKVKNDCKKNKRKGEGIRKKDIPSDEKDLYILKSQIVPPVCPECPDLICNADEERRKEKKRRDKRERGERRRKDEWDRKQKHGWDRQYTNNEYDRNSSTPYNDTNTSFPTIFPSWNSLMQKHKSKSTVQLDGPNNKIPMPMLNDFSNF